MRGTTWRTSRTNRGRRLLASIVALLAAGGLTAVGIGEAGAAIGSGYESAVAQHTNAERSQRNLPSTSWSRCLDRFAEAQATKMARKQSLEHQELAPIVRTCGLDLAGENVAMGYPNGKAATAAWMNSSGHRANILKRGYRMHGVGAYRDAAGTWWVAHVFGRRA